MKKILISACLVALAITNVNALDLNDYINESDCSQIITKPNYKVCYDYGLKSARYVAYTVDGNKLKEASTHVKKRPSFYPENSIPIKYRAYPSDYTKSGYDRGHMANHADFDYSANLVYLTYSMANIVPQNPDLNRHSWVKVEKYERNIAKKLGYVNVLNIITYQDEPNRIGKHKIAVPDNFIKVIYNDDQKFYRCFSYSNNYIESTEQFTLTDHQVSCNMMLN